MTKFTAESGTGQSVTTTHWAPAAKIALVKAIKPSEDFIELAWKIKNKKV